MLCICYEAHKSSVCCLADELLFAGSVLFCLADELVVWRKSTKVLFCLLYCLTVQFVAGR